MRIFSFDLESTGKYPDKDRIVQYAYQVLDSDLKVLDARKALVHPGIPIPPLVSAIHGITDKDVKDQPRFPAHAAALQAVVDSCTHLMGHNGDRFDKVMLHYELVRAGQPGIPLDKPVIDTLVIEQTYTPHKLGGLYKRLTGKELDGAHDASKDLDATVEILRIQRERYGIQSLEAATAHHLRQEDFRLLNHAGHFYEDKDGNIRLGFGAHEDCLAHERLDYLQWMAGPRATFPPDTVELCRRILRGENLSTRRAVLAPGA